MQSFSHSVVLSVYHLEYKNEEWIMHFKHKTGALRDVIYELNPDLKGKNLNSQDFLNETEIYVINTLNLKSDGKALKLSPIFMRYGGHNFEASFEVKGFREKPNAIDITTSGFDDHEHSVKILTLDTGIERFRHQFFKEKSTASFSFDNKQFSASKNQTPKENPIFLGIAAILISIILIGKLVIPKLKSAP